MTPKRIQLRRTRGWRKPEGAIVVARPTKWGNPVRVGVWASVGGTRPNPAGRLAATTFIRDVPEAVLYYRLGVRSGGLLVGTNPHDAAWAPLPTVDEIRASLAGHDLACWCPRDQPCHGDVLLEIANGGAS